MLDLLDKRGIRLAGNRAPYGFSGTTEWLENIADALGMDVSRKIEALKAQLHAQIPGKQGTPEGQAGVCQRRPGQDYRAFARP